MWQMRMRTLELYRRSCYSYCLLSLFQLARHSERHGVALASFARAQTRGRSCTTYLKEANLSDRIVIARPDPPPTSTTMASSGRLAHGKPARKLVNLCDFLNFIRTVDDGTNSREQFRRSKGMDQTFQSQLVPVLLHELKKSLVCGPRRIERCLRWETRMPPLRVFHDFTQMTSGFEELVTPVIYG